MSGSVTEKKRINDMGGQILSPFSWYMHYQCNEKLLPTLSSMLSLCPEERGVVSCYGKVHPKPRFDKVYGDKGVTYKYSGVKYDTAPWPPILLDLKSHLETQLRSEFNFCVVNWYMNGQDYVSAHQDNEPGIDQKTPIVSVSLGTTRKFRIRNKKTRKITLEKRLKHGDIFVMGGRRFQKDYTHEIVKQSKRLVRSLRISITFRKWQSVEL